MLLVIYTFTLLQLAYGHIRLTYPPARDYALDFLDNVRTPPPCGMPKGNGKVTSLKTNTNVTVTWDTAYVHMGGYMIDLLDAQENVKTAFVGQWTGAQDKTTMSHTVSLGNEECIGCTLRLRRQAIEWSRIACGFEYIFWSCANVNIKASTTTQEMCSGNGQHDGSACICTNDMYFGDKCQYVSECQTDTDCSNHGSCVETDPGSTYRPKKCFCNAGYMGKTCNTMSPLNAKITDFSSYTKNVMSPDPVFEIYHKEINGTEIEMIVRSKTNNWIAVGWRPSDYKSGCQAFPTIDFGTPQQGVTTPVPEPVTTQAGCASEPEGEPSSEPEPETETEPSGETYVVPTTGGTPHPMDCTDIVVGAARGNQHWIGDFYTRDRSQPERDEFYGGQDSLTAAYGYEENGETFVIFRRPIKATENSDHTINAEAMHVIWAEGQITDFYNQDVLKYHGRRGKTTIQFLGATGSSVVVRYSADAVIITNMMAIMVAGFF